MKQFVFCACLAVVFLSVNAVHAACSGTIRNAPLFVDYPPFSLGGISEEMSVNISAKCDWRFVMVDTADGDQTLASGLTYDFLDHAGQSVVISDSTVNTTDGTTGAKGSRQVSLTFKIHTKNSVLPSGNITKRLEAHLYDKETNDLLSKQTFPVTIQIPQNLQISLSGATLARDTAFPDQKIFSKVLDFGELQTGAKRRVNVQIRSNDDYTLDISSDNYGVMQHKELGKDWKIPYDAVLNSELLNLNTPNVLKHYSATQFNGIVFPFSVTIGDISNAHSGSYSDIIRFTVKSRI